MKIGGMKRLSSTRFQSGCGCGSPWHNTPADSCGLLHVNELVRRQVVQRLDVPDGQRMTAFSICGFLPRPKCSRRSFSDAKPLPPETY